MQMKCDRTLNASRQFSSRRLNRIQTENGRVLALQRLRRGFFNQRVHSLPRHKDLRSLDRHPCDVNFADRLCFLRRGVRTCDGGAAIACALHGYISFLLVHGAAEAG